MNWTSVLYETQQDD